MNTKNIIHPHEPTIIFAERELRDQSAQNFLDTTKANNIVIDLSMTKHIDTKSLTALLKAQAIIVASGYKLTLVKPQAPIRTLLYMTKIYHQIPSFSQHLQALTFLEKQSQSLQEQQL